MAATLTARDLTELLDRYAVESHDHEIVAIRAVPGSRALALVVSGPAAHPRGRAAQRAGGTPQSAARLGRLRSARGARLARALRRARGTRPGRRPRPPPGGKGGARRFRRGQDRVDSARGRL